VGRIHVPHIPRVGRVPGSHARDDAILPRSRLPTSACYYPSGKQIELPAGRKSRMGSPHRCDRIRRARSLAPRLLSHRAGCVASGESRTCALNLSRLPKPRRNVQPRHGRPAKTPWCRRFNPVLARHCSYGETRRGNGSCDIDRTTSRHLGDIHSIGHEATWLNKQMEFIRLLQQEPARVTWRTAGSMPTIAEPRGAA